MSRQPLPGAAIPSPQAEPSPNDTASSPPDPNIAAGTASLTTTPPAVESTPVPDDSDTGSTLSPVPQPEPVTVSELPPPQSLTFGGAQAQLRDKYQDDPIQLRASLDTLENQYTSAKVAAGTQKILAQAKLDSAIDGLGAALKTGIDTPAKGQTLVDQIGSDGAFETDPEARSNAYLALRNHVDALASGLAPHGLGDQFTDALAAFAGGAPVAKSTLLKMLAQNRLTPEGYSTLNTVSDDPAEARMLSATLSAARAQLSSAPGGDRDGEIFNDHFLPTFMHFYQMGRAQGKQPLDLLTPGGKDEVVQPLIGVFSGMRMASIGDKQTPTTAGMASPSEQGTVSQKAAQPLSVDAMDSGHDLPADKGAEIVASAALWRGTPYAPNIDSDIYKGPGAARGHAADCSGSVWKIYSDAGYKYKYQDTASFAAAAKSGKIPFRSIDPKDLRPGDVILYPPSSTQSGHMSIYAGNGMVWSAHKDPLPFAQFRIGVFKQFQAYRYVSH